MLQETFLLFGEQKREWIRKSLAPCLERSCIIGTAQDEVSLDVGADPATAMKLMQAMQSGGDPLAGIAAPSQPAALGNGTTAKEENKDVNQVEKDPKDPVNKKPPREKKPKKAAARFQTVDIYSGAYVHG